MSLYMCMRVCVCVYVYVRACLCVCVFVRLNAYRKIRVYYLDNLKFIYWQGYIFCFNEVCDLTFRD